MKHSITGKAQQSFINIDAIAGIIADTQLNSGEIPWYDGDKTDPWDHVEAAMGLTTGGYFKEARRAFDWMIQNQLPDGSWYSAYQSGIPLDTTRESNMSSYIAVGVFHNYLITQDMAFLRAMWKTIEKAITFTLSLQSPGGEIWWAVSPEGNIDKMALLTGSSSIHMSLRCALFIARLLGYAKPEWERALKNLGESIRQCPHRFNVTKARYSMDWFYPILSGAVTGEHAKKRIDRYWKKFVIQGEGVRCVSDQPWVTIAETSEFCLALSAMNNHSLSKIIFGWICDKTYDDGTYWCGHTCPDMTIWPEERISWTNAVVLLAADAIYDLTPAARLFCHDFWKKSGFGH